MSKFMLTLTFLLAVSSVAHAEKINKSERKPAAAGGVACRLEQFSGGPADGIADYLNRNCNTSLPFSVSPYQASSSWHIVCCSPRQ